MHARFALAIVLLSVALASPHHSRLRPHKAYTLTLTVDGHNSATNPSLTESALAAESATTGSSGTCSSGTATVTYKPTVTVTVSPLTSSAGDAFVQSTPTPTSSEDEAGQTEVPIVPSATSALFTSASEEAETTSTEVLQSIIPTPETSASEQAETISTEVLPSIVPTPKTSAVPEYSQTPTPAAPEPSATPYLTPQVTSPATPKTGSSNKRGLIAALADQDALVAAFNKYPKITWLGNWYSSPPGKLDSHIEFVPQNYGKDSDTGPDFWWTKNARKAEAAGQKYFLSFGEPETPNDKLHMEPQEAVDLFLKEMQPYTDKVTVGAPAVLQPDKDLQWLSEFLDLCDAAKCNIGFVPIHWFWSAEGHAGNFKDTVNSAIKIAKGKPVWVDNFQATGTNAQQQKFLEEVLPWLDANDAVERYAYVSTDRTTGTGFINGDGSISSLGEFYATS